MGCLASAGSQVRWNLATSWRTLDLRIRLRLRREKRKSPVGLGLAVWGRAVCYKRGREKQDLKAKEQILLFVTPASNRRELSELLWVCSSVMGGRIWPGGLSCQRGVKDAAPGTSKAFWAADSLAAYPHGNEQHCSVCGESLPEDFGESYLLLGSNPAPIALGSFY